jgi:hypothetical protein
MGRRLIACLSLTAVLLGAGTSVASAGQLPAPGGFRVKASNGYTLRALSFDGDPHEKPDALLLFLSRKGSAALYAVQKGVEVTEESISADLGELGSIDLRFVPVGRPRDEAPSCEQRSFEFDAGTYDGTFDFEGEEGFTELHAARVRGEAKFGLSLICGMGVDEGAGGHAPGARLSVNRRQAEEHTMFEAWKNSPTRPAYFEASIEERRGSMSIYRGISAKAGPGSFEFDVPSQTARVRPPSPFAGFGRFDRMGSGKGKIHGQLSVNFPGRSDVSLSGARGSLIRYVRNPAHPFRPQVTPRLAVWPSPTLPLTAFATPSLLAPFVPSSLD